MGTSRVWKIWHLCSTARYAARQLLTTIRHNASAVAIIQSCMKQLPNVKNIASFDSAFHQHMPEYVKTYAIDQKIAKEKGLRKYGFHGISYSYITRTVADYLHKKSSELSIIALHLGSGASACAIRNGQSIDTSMGLTPVSGLPGGSRSGDIDPSLIFHYTSTASKMSPSSTKDLHISQAEEILNKQSGWKALAGTTDFSKIAEPNAPPSHKLTFDIFLDRIVGYVGDYFVKLDGKVDALVFAGGIGEKSALLRERVTQKCSCLGFSLDKERNNNPGADRVVEIGKREKTATLVCKTDEEVGEPALYHCLLLTISSSKWPTPASRIDYEYEPISIINKSYVKKQGSGSTLYFPTGTTISPSTVLMFKKRSTPESIMLLNSVRLHTVRLVAMAWCYLQRAELLPKSACQLPGGGKRVPCPIRLTWISSINSIGAACTLLHLNIVLPRVYFMNSLSD